MLETALHQQLASLREATDPAAALEVQSLVCDYVDDRKAEGWPVERVIVSVKEIARDAGIRTSTFVEKPQTPVMTTDQLLVEMIRWCICRYYEQEEERGSGPWSS